MTDKTVSTCNRPDATSEYGLYHVDNTEHEERRGTAESNCIHISLR